MSVSQQLKIDIRADADLALAELKSVTTSLKRLEGEVKRGATSTKQLQSSFESVGRSAGNFAKTLAGLAAGYASLSGAREFVSLLGEMEQGYIGVAKTTGLAGEELDKLKAGIEGLATTMSGVSLGELQSIAETAGQLGISGTENIVKFTETIAKMAITTEMSADQAATVMAQLGNALQEPVSNYEKMASVMNELSNNTAGLVGSIADVAGRFAGMGKTVGLTTEQIFGLSAAMIDLGVSTEVSGTALATIFGQMLQRTEEFAKVSKVSAKEYAETMRKDPVAALKLFLSELGKLDPQRQVAALKDLGLSGIRVSAAVLKLSGNLSVLDKSLKISNEEWKRGTSQQKEYEAASQGLEQQWQRTKNTLAVLAGKIGQELMPVLKEVNERFREWVDGLDEETLRSFGESVASLVDGLAKLAGAVGMVVGPMASFAANNVLLTAGLIALYKSVGGLPAVLGRLAGAMGTTAASSAKLSGAAASTTTAMGILRGSFGALMTLLGPGGAIVAGAFAGVAGAMELYRQSVEKDTEANRQSAEQMSQHVRALETIGQAYSRANQEMQQRGSVTRQTAEQVRQALEQEIAAIEKQLSAWEKNADSTEEQDRAAKSLAGTLGDLKAKLDTLDADYTIDVGADTSEAEASVEEVSAKVESADPTLTIKPDAGRALAVIEKLKKPTSSVHTVYVRTVEQHAIGGPVGLSGRALALSRGGKVPGYDPGDSDSVLARLTRGEFVIRRKAVDYFGTGLLHAINSLRLPKLPGYAEGGSVGGSTASPALQPINLNIAGKNFPMMSDKEVAEALTRYLKREGGF